MPGRGKGTHSTKPKPYSELTEGAKRARKSREKKARLKADGTPDRRFGPRVQVTDIKTEPLPEIKIPGTEEEVDKRTKEEKLRQLIIENDRNEGKTLYLEEAKEMYIKLYDAFLQGYYLFPDKFKTYQPKATEKDIHALQRIIDEAIQLVKVHALD